MSTQRPINNLKKFSPYSKNRTKVCSNDLRSELEKEMNQAIHSKKIFFIENSLWLIPLVVIIGIASIIDLIVVLAIWKNPIVLFEQIKIGINLVIAYILGLVTDYIRQRIVKY